MSRDSVGGTAGDSMSKRDAQQPPLGLWMLTSAQSLQGLALL